MLKLKIKKLTFCVFIISGLFLILYPFGCTTNDTAEPPELLGSFINSGTGGISVVATELIFIFGVRQDWEEPDVLFVANVQQSFTPNDVDEIFIINASVDDDFPTICDLLSNGTKELCYVGYKFPNGGGGSGHYGEDYLFQGGVTGEFNPDFQGCTIHSIGITPTSLTLNTPGSDPNQNGIWTDFDFDIELKVYGYRSSNGA